MFRFWSSDATRGSLKPADVAHHMQGLIRPAENEVDSITLPIDFAAPSPKRRRQSSDGDSPHEDLLAVPVTKRSRIEKEDAASVDAPPVGPSGAGDMARAKEVIHCQFGLEILLKHDELRLINQELAKCQIALEQLRRCHLIPYPVTCPTPQQMLDMSSGKGAALQPRSGQPVPKWAPPFGVVDGPYARHYAKWLIPDPIFDGILPEWPGLPDTGRARNAQEGRTTRNSFIEPLGFGKQRPSRGGAGQKLHALSNGYPQPKEKAGPCVLKRSDGHTVKLVCIDCNRENFSSTQGFINHCRIAHRRDFKSHEEAAVHCGHPIDVDVAGSAVAEEKQQPGVPLSTPGFTHPLARSNAMTDQEAYSALRSRIETSLKMFHQGQLRGVSAIPGAKSVALAKAPAEKPSKAFVPSTDTPFLSRLMQNREFSGDLSEQVHDAKTKMDLDDMFSPGEDSEDPDRPSNLDGTASPPDTSRTPPVMRVPARVVVSPVPFSNDVRPSSSKGRSPHTALTSLANQTAAGTVPEKEEEPAVSEDEMDVDLSPNTMASNNAPSLVSDDGEYDDSDDGSASDASDGIEAESVSDVAEINLEEDADMQGHEPPRSLRHHRGTTTAAVKLRKDEAKHVTFVSPVRDSKDRRKQKA